ESLTEKLRIPGQLDVGARRSQPLDQLGQPHGGTDRYRRLADKKRRPVQVTRHLADRTLDVTEIGGVRAFLLRGADADEMHIAELSRVGVRRGEAELTGLQGLGQQLGKARLKERDLTSVQVLDLGWIDINTEHLVTQDGHTDRVRRAEVTGAANGQ